MKIRKMIAVLCVALVLAVMCIALCACNSDNCVELVKNGETTLAVIGGTFNMNGAILVKSAKKYSDGSVIIETANFGTITTKIDNVYLISGDLSRYSVAV